jgi:acetyltransferase-like isoleucine patch superfamily enzyme
MHLSQIPRGILYLVNRRWVDEGGGRILHNDWRVPLKVRKGAGARITLRGDLRIDSYQGDRSAVVITLGNNSSLHVDGDFVLTQDTKIVLGEGAHLYIGGDHVESGCGTTGNCRIMVKKKVHIGTDFLCSWNVFITDCDWHTLNGGPGQKDTYIGDHVWVTCNCSILKGSKINSGCVLANGTVVHDQAFGPNEFVLGNPATAAKKIGEWKR